MTRTVVREDITLGAQWALWGLAPLVSAVPVQLASGAYERVTAQHTYYSSDPGKWSALQIMPIHAFPSHLGPQPMSAANFTSRRADSLRADDVIHTRSGVHTVKTTQVSGVGAAEIIVSCADGEPLAMYCSALVNTERTPA